MRGKPVEGHPPNPPVEELYKGPGHQAKDGYSTSARRPRGSKSGQILPHEEADRIEGFNKEYGEYMPYSHYDD